MGSFTARHNASNQRTKKVAGASTTHYVYGAGGLLYGEYDNAGALIREYVYLNDEPLAQINAGSPETLTYLHPDHLGTPRFGTNTGGSQVWAWASDAFGNGTPSGSATVNLRMPGQYYDAESGIFYNWNRYYNPEIGRYISSDPIGLEGGMNTFLYAEANPLLYSDVEGLISACMPGQNCQPVLAPSAVGGGAIGLIGGGIGAGIVFSSEDPKASKPTSQQGQVCTPEGLLGGAKDVDTRGSVTQGIKSGGSTQADKDFDNLAQPGTVKVRPDGVRTGKTSDGRDVNVRPNSSSGRPTVEIINPDGSRIKIRY